MDKYKMENCKDCNKETIKKGLRSLGKINYIDGFITAFSITNLCWLIGWMIKLSLN